MAASCGSVVRRTLGRAEVLRMSILYSVASTAPLPRFAHCYVAASQSTCRRQAQGEVCVKLQVYKPGSRRIRADVGCSRRHCSPASVINPLWVKRRSSVCIPIENPQMPAAQISVWTVLYLVVQMAVACCRGFGGKAGAAMVIVMYVIKYLARFIIMINGLRPDGHTRLLKASRPTDDADVGRSELMTGVSIGL